ncbi:MAG: glycosyltransferase family 2 protein [Candidatus Krumholzibacteriales bacterium]
MKDKRSVSMVIPAYNEEQSLEELYSRLKEVLDRIASRYEFIFIDDGSTDKSLEIMYSLRERDRSVKIIAFQRNYGKSAALSEGFRAAGCDYVVTIDADLQDNPEEIPEMIEMLEEGADLVSGWKVNRQDPLTKTLPSKIFNLVTSAVSKVKLHDFNCGLKAYRKDVVKNISVYGELHRFIPVLASWEGFRIAEKKVTHFERKFGRSKYGTKRFLNGFFDLMTVMFITRRASSPLHFFGRVAVLFFLIGGLINLYFLIKWLAGGGLHVRPIMVGGMLMIVIAIQIASFGLFAELFSSRSRQSFSIKEYLIDE